jgi:uncharacterized membrane protein YoaK (UPF0700 family)
MDQMIDLSLQLLDILGLFSLVYPLVTLWRCHRRTSLRHAVIWSTLAWSGWAAALLIEGVGWPVAPWRYLALSLTAAAGVAVLGARQPGMAAWNFVVAGLLAVLSLPLAEQSLQAPNWRLDEPRGLFLVLLLGFAVGNYLPTRWAMAAGAAAIWFGAEILRLVAGGQFPAQSALGALAAACIWFAFPRQPRPARGEFDRVWFAFRDSYGLVWGLRAMEQFNHAARHAGWSVSLTWHGFAGLGPSSATSEAQRHEMMQVLQGILQRFIPV